MKVLKYIGFTILGILLLALIAALFVPKQKTYSSEIKIKKSQQALFDYLRMLKNQEEFSYFIKEAPSIQLQYKGTDGEVGIISSWTSEEMGDGSQILTKIVNTDSIFTELDFGMGGKPAVSVLALQSLNPEETKVYYGVTMYSSYPMNITFLLFNMNHAFETSLLNLKSIMEKQ